jgi:hypothetical protein
MRVTGEFYNIPEIRDNPDNGKIKKGVKKGINK